MKSIKNSLRSSQLLNDEVNNSLKWGDLFASIFSISSAVYLIIFNILGLLDVNFIIFGIAVLGSLFLFKIYLLGRKKKINRLVRIIVILIIMSIPSLILFSGNFSSFSENLTFFTGPVLFLYFFFLIMTGFLFETKICVFSGIFLAAQYFILYLFNQEQIMLFIHPNKHTLQGITVIPSYIFRMLIIIFSGLLLGALINNTKRLIKKIFIEEKEKKKSDKLFGEYVSKEVKNKIILLENVFTLLSDYFKEKLIKLKKINLKGKTDKVLIYGLLNYEKFLYNFK